MLSLAMMFSFTACKKEEVEPDDSPLAYTQEVDLSNYDAESDALYQSVYGEYYEYYANAKKANSISERFTLMAIAEAKVLETATLLPLTSNGGNYAIGRVVPYTATPCLWGNDSYRYYRILSVEEWMTNADRNELKALYKELKGTGTYYAKAQEFLAGKGYHLKDTYTIGYSSDPQTWDVLATSRSADSEAIINTYDGLYEYNIENELQPALATGFEISADGLKYTFKIREGVKWVDSQGREIAEVTADDWVAAMQHCCDAQEGLEGLFGESGAHIVNADEYVYGEVTDFEQVGVKALDKYTLEYTLTEPTSYFPTMLGYGVFAPMNRQYFLSQGGQFGVDNWDPTAAKYGTDPEHIAYCGAYLVTATPENSIVFSLNDSYWNKENVHNKTITWLYNDGSDVLKSYKDANAGILTSCGLNASALVQAEADGFREKDMIYISGTDATSFCAFFNFNRKQFANVNDSSLVQSELTVNKAAKADAAMKNIHFRRALMFALDRASYNAQTTGDDLKYASMINSFTPGTFVQLDEEVTVKINGKDKTYPSGTFFGQIVQDQIDADGVKIKAWDASADSGIGSSTQYDGWYNLDNAKAEMKEAIKELKKQGVNVSATNPVYIDFPAYVGSEVYLNRANAFKQSIENAFEGAVIVNITQCEKAAQWYWAGYYTNAGYEANYHMYDVSGWGPDYGDPSTYLENFVPGGYMIKCVGIY